MSAHVHACNCCHVQVAHADLGVLAEVLEQLKLVLEAYLQWDSQVGVTLCRLCSLTPGTGGGGGGLGLNSFCPACHLSLAVPLNAITCKTNPERWMQSA